ncbi:protein of unknown function (DUF1848) [Desulfosporosinus orientis DSM 765]|uniref:DNA repair photolyase n=1 Tax=Desulfosporosinus orientis (strain ATCC 19365 / DSM 765 / NCIMB 8382 / VKM B-1628 / Singapore I) TaxID=768706 RepID=G7WFI1_DESOD|nr:DUF1848 domain-containing protein [Desulfosporosinus orientis]AET68424.1 protein of unknown function (DUF1848) [Desulfosporosinus orientis DSM 765]
MIVSVSRRTDIPCYYTEWLINRLKEGFVITRNPMNKAQISRLPLNPELVDCLVFWTKDAENILRSLKLIDEMGFKYYFQHTLTPYDRTLEQNLQDKLRIEDTFIELSQLIGKERVMWRYDPIVLNDRLTIDYHKVQFERLCQKLAPFTESVTISFVQTYRKLKTPLIRAITCEEKAELAGFIGETAKAWGLTPKACCEKTDLTPYGIQKASCIDKAVLERVCGCSLDISPDKNQRQGCGCIESIDIGVYNTCPNGCVYCYANDSQSIALERYNSRQPDSDILCGSIAEEEKITDRKCKSNKQQQLSLF